MQITIRSRTRREPVPNYGVTFFNLGWANRSADTLTCTSCGRIEWYLTYPEEVG